ncbi:hypothetical protein BDV30DRAFT_235120 [Aspergillus minisclerotigenes]|uniref:Uncharacterized protein n=1 Tax=Aspergillus minisclerotigenes TaxID=656917 RepID=A0A5N6JDC9_9EURO|nr:hypothetical protein BDV30DRAFT_235120 [Aspergillus minisclerotigenes]
MILPAALATFFLLLRCTSAEPPADFPDNETPYRVIPTGTDAPDATGTVSPNNIRGTYLYGYVGCEQFKGAKGKIDDAYYDAWLIFNTAGVASNIDWNNAAALEFLGVSGLNKVQQPQIQAVFANMGSYAKIGPITIRHCQPDLPNPDETQAPKSLLYAYLTNSDPDSSGTLMINFCEGFFDRRSLADTITYGKALVMPHNLRLSSYNNRAQTFLHELFHLDLAADSPRPNPRIDDLMIDIKIGSRGGYITRNAYGTLTTKILARWHLEENRHSVKY